VKTLPGWWQGDQPGKVLMGHGDRQAAGRDLSRADLGHDGGAGWWAVRS